MFPCVFVTFLYGILGQAWYLIVSIPDLCLPFYCIKKTQSSQALYLFGQRFTLQVGDDDQLNYFSLRLKIVSDYIRKYHKHKPQATPWHREEEPLNHHEIPGRQNKQSNQLSLLHQDDCNNRMDIKLRTTKQRTSYRLPNGSNNKQKVNNNFINVI